MAHAGNKLGRSSLLQFPWQLSDSIREEFLTEIQNDARYLMRRASRAISQLCLMFMVVSSSFLVSAQTEESQADTASADAQNPSELLKTVDRLVEQNNQLEKQNRELMDQIESLRKVLTKQAAAIKTETQPVATSTTAKTPQEEPQTAATDLQMGRLRA